MAGYARLCVPFEDAPETRPRRGAVAKLCDHVETGSKREMGLNL